MYLSEKKRAIIVVSFGTTYRHAVETCIAPIEHEIAAAFPSYHICRAFTSRFVRRRLAQEGMMVEGLEAVLQRLSDDGYEEVIVQPTHIIEGAEYRDRVWRVAESYRDRFARLVIGRPLLDCETSDACLSGYLAIAHAILAQIPPLGQREAVVLMGHGSKCACGSVYCCLQQAFDSLKKAALIGVMEEGDVLSFDKILEKLARYEQVRLVHLMPLLLVAGCHTQKDMTGEGRSWQARLEERGYSVRPYLHGLGENPAVRALYVQRVSEMVIE